MSYYGGGGHGDGYRGGGHGDGYRGGGGGGGQDYEGGPPSGGGYGGGRIPPPYIDEHDQDQGYDYHGRRGGYHHRGGGSGGPPPQSQYSYDSRRAANVAPIVHQQNPPNPLQTHPQYQHLDNAPPHSHHPHHRPSPPPPNRSFRTHHVQPPAAAAAASSLPVPALPVPAPPPPPPVARVAADPRRANVMPMVHVSPTADHQRNSPGSDLELKKRGDLLQAKLADAVEMEKKLKQDLINKEANWLLNQNVRQEKIDTLTREVERAQKRSQDTFEALSQLNNYKKARELKTSLEAKSSRLRNELSDLRRSSGRLQSRLGDLRRDRRERERRVSLQLGADLAVLEKEVDRSRRDLEAIRQSDELLTRMILNWGDAAQEAALQSYERARSLIEHHQSIQRVDFSSQIPEILDENELDLIDDD